MPLLLLAHKVQAPIFALPLVLTHRALVWLSPYRLKMCRKNVLHQNTANDERYTFIDTEMHGQILLMCHPKNDSINDYIHYNYEQVLLFTHINNVQRNGYIF